MRPGRNRLLAPLLAAATLSLPALARGEDGAAAKGALREPSANDDTSIKRSAVELNPLDLLIHEYSLTFEAMTGLHHALVLTPSFVSLPGTSAPEIIVSAGGQLGTVQTLNYFTGAGVEIGYRYYTSERGLMGVYVGPSLLAGVYRASFLDGPEQTFLSVGGAVDVGYQVAIGSLVLGLGGGAQYRGPTRRVPSQMLPMSIWSDTGLHPRFLLTVGYGW